MKINGEYSLKNCLYPYWKGDTVYNESVMVHSDINGKLSPISLLYPIAEIIEVRCGNLKTVYREKQDYILEDGRLVIPEGSSVPITDYATLHPETRSDSCKEAVDGGFLLYDEKLQLRQIHVTYRAKTKEGVAFPTCKKAAFPKTIKKLESGETLKLHFFGDSITTGCSASGFFKYAPFMPIWPLMVTDELKRLYPDADIQYSNAAVGGKCSRWATETSEERLKSYGADLVVIAFGMNDGPKSPDRYGIYNRQLILDAKEANPDCEILEVSTTLPNKAFKRFYGNQDIFVSVLKNLCANYDFAELADMTEIHRSMLQRKRFEDISGNHINHPNDFLSRVYAQTVLQTLVGID